MLLYIHVPFCRTKCHYCTFYSLPLPLGAKGTSLASEYLQTIFQEIHIWKERLGNTSIETIFFGGGTPSLIPAKALGAILNEVDKYFSVASKAEITVEANPESAIENNWIADVKKLGINRLSFGVQSFDEEYLGMLGRIHSPQHAFTAIEQAHKANFSSISIDLMWGLPGIGKSQQLRHWLRTLETAVHLDINHISAYGLTLEANSTLTKLAEAGKVTFPSETTLSAMYLQGAEYLESQGFMQYEISNFARLGYECRHNLGYWEGASYLGIGPSATSTLGKKRWSNPDCLTDWKECVEKQTVGSSHIAKYGAEFEELSEAIQLQEIIMLRLRTAKGLNLQKWTERTGQNFLQQYAPLIKTLQKNQLASVRNGHFRLTRAGMLVSSAIIEHFFSAK